MKRLFELVLKVVNESNRSDIFWCYGRSSNYLSSNPMDSISYNDKHYLNNAAHSEVDSTFNFKFKFKDGDPDVGIELNHFQTTETKTEEVKTGWFWNIKTTGGRVSVVKSYPVYKINAGELSYITTVDEAKQLHKAYIDLLQRDKESTMKKQEFQIIKRLENKVELETRKHE